MKKLNLALLSGVCVLTLSSCSWLSDWPQSGSQRASAPAPAPQARIVQTADATYMDSSAEQQPVERMVPENPANAAMQDRIADLEAQMAQMRNDMSMMMPALTRLAEVQGDLQALLSSQIQPAAGGMPQNIYDRAPAEPSPQKQNASVTPQENTRAPQGNALAPQKTAVAPQAAAQKAAPPPQSNTDTVPASTGGNEIKAVRFGEHPDKTRIVLDVSDKIAFDYDIDNGEQILMLELGADWGGDEQHNVSGSDMVSAYSAMPDGQGGTRVAIQLKKAGQISWAQYIPPAAGKNHRIVLDVTSM